MGSTSINQAEFDRCSRSQSKVLDSHMKIITEQMSQISALVDGMDDLREELQCLREENCARFTNISSILDDVVSAESVATLQRRVEHFEKSLAEETGRCNQQIVNIEKAATENHAFAQARIIDLELAHKNLADEQTQYLEQLCQELRDQTSHQVSDMDKLVEDLKVSHGSQIQELAAVPVYTRLQQSSDRAPHHRETRN